MGKVKNFFSNKSLPAKVGIIIVGIISLFILFQIVGYFIAMFILICDAMFSRKHTYTDVENYTNYIGVNCEDEYSGKWGMDESIFPEQITDSMNVDEFSFTYYNPWDAQYVGYLTVTYSQEEYETESKVIALLNQFGGVIIKKYEPLNVVGTDVTFSK